jgi:hypothetical protein
MPIPMIMASSTYRVVNFALKPEHEARLLGLDTWDVQSSHVLGTWSLKPRKILRGWLAGCICALLMKKAGSFLPRHEEAVYSFHKGWSKSREYGYSKGFIP